MPICGYKWFTIELVLYAQVIEDWASSQQTGWRYSKWSTKFHEISRHIDRKHSVKQYVIRYSEHVSTRFAFYFILVSVHFILMDK